MESIVETFKKIPDWRGAKGKQYPLHKVLAASVAARAAGAKSLREVADWMADNRHFLREAGIAFVSTPKKSQLALIYSGLHFEGFQEIIKACANDSMTGQICADGKDARGARLSFFSVFDAKSMEILSRIPFSKGYEINVLQELIASSALSGRMVSADAIHCQKKHSKRLAEPILA